MRIMSETTHGWDGSERQIQGRVADGDVQRDEEGDGLEDEELDGPEEGHGEGLTDRLRRLLEVERRDVGDPADEGEAPGL